MKQYDNGNGRKMKDQLNNKPTFILSNIFLTKIREILYTYETRLSTIENLKKN